MNNRVSIATIGGFLPVTNFVLQGLITPSDQSWQMRLDYAVENIVKSFLPVSIEPPEQWAHPNHPHVEWVWPFYVDARSKSTPSTRWGSVKVHMIWGTYVPILLGMLTHRIFNGLGINRVLERNRIPFDI